MKRQLAAALALPVLVGCSTTPPSETTSMPSSSTSSVTPGASLPGEPTSTTAAPPEQAPLAGEKGEGLSGDVTEVSGQELGDLESELDALVSELDALLGELANAFSQEEGDI